LLFLVHLYLLNYSRRVLAQNLNNGNQQPTALSAAGPA